MFGRKMENGTIGLFHDGGEVVTRLGKPWPVVWPVNSDVSAYYEHPDGIFLDESGFAKLGSAVKMEV